MVTPLIPNSGIGALLFGASLSRAIDYFGDGAQREHPYEDGKQISVHYATSGLHLGFDSEGRLETAIVDFDSSDCSLLGDTLRDVFGSSCDGKSVRAWLDKHSLEASESFDCVGCCNFFVEALNLTLSLEDEGGGTVEIRSAHNATLTPTHDPL